MKLRKREEKLINIFFNVISEQVIMARNTSSFSKVKKQNILLEKS